MKRGKVSDTILDRSVFKLLGRRGNTSKPAYGQDAAHIHNQGWDTLAAAATGSLAVYRAVNNISAAGGAADCIMNTIIIDEKSREIRLKEIIKELDRQCQVVGVGIAGGHTTVCPNVNSPVVSVTAIGHKLRTHQKAVAGQDIVMTKHIGMSGIRTVISHKRDEILNVLPEDVINKAFAADEELIIAKEAQIFIKQNIDGAMHDASEGGIFALPLSLPPSISTVLVVMLCRAYQQELTLVAFESLMKSIPRTRATFSRRCSTPLKSESALRIFSLVMPARFAEIPAASEL